MCVWYMVCVILYLAGYFAAEPIVQALYTQVSYYQKVSWEVYKKKYGDFAVFLLSN